MPGHDRPRAFRQRLADAAGALALVLLLAAGAGMTAQARERAAATVPPTPNATQDEAMTWKDDIKRLARHGTENVEAYTDAAWRRFANRMQFSQARQIMAYSGYGNLEHVWVHGRVLANKPIRGPEDDDSWWDNLKATYSRWETDEVAGAEVELLYGDQRQIVVTDDEGYYRARFAIDKDYPQDDVVLARTRGKRGIIAAAHRITIPDADAPFMVISDMDDTVIHTGITDVLLAARLTFLNNAKTRKPLAGVAGLYRAIARGGGEGARVPFFYVSNSGWNMYDLLRDFIELNDIPHGPLLLRDLGLNRGEDSTSDHKAQTFRELLARYPHLNAVLIGDSGQHDAELYASLAREFPDRVKAIYIRDVDPDETSAHDAKVDAIIEDFSGSGVPMLLGRDSDVFAAHMTRVGILPDHAKPEVAASVDRDAERESVTGL